MAHAQRHFIPAAGADWLLPFYDPFTRLVGTPAALRELVAQAELAPAQRVLDLGCGTGATTALAKRTQPGIEIVGLDPDDKALARARRKAERARLAIGFVQGFGDALPFPDGRFDRVLSSFMLHHLEAAEKPAVLRELRRVLRPGGSLHVVDFANLRGNAGDALPRLLREAGFREAAASGARRSLLGSIGYVRARA